MMERVWDTLERWRSVALLAAGGAFLAIGINFGARATANTGVEVSPLLPLALVLVVYAGLLGLSPRLVERAPRLGRLGQVLVLALGAEIVLTFVAILLPVSVPVSIFAVVVATTMVGAALTVTVFGAASLRTGAYSRPVGGFLLLAAVGLSVGIASNVLFGALGPEWLTAVNNGLFGVSLAVVGYALRTEGGPTERPESTESVA